MSFFVIVEISDKRANECREETQYFEARAEAEDFVRDYLRDNPGFDATKIQIHNSNDYQPGPENPYIMGVKQP